MDERWEVDNSGFNIKEAGKSHTVAMTQPHGRMKQRARLIAAAPEMLEQLRIAADWINAEINNIGPCDHSVGLCVCGDRSMLADIRAAIAKATGGAS